MQRGSNLVQQDARISRVDILTSQSGDRQVLSISKRRAGSHEYFLSLIGYYGRGKKGKRKRGAGDRDPFHPDPAVDPSDIDQVIGEPPGIWLGTGAWKTGLTGIIVPDDYIAVMDGKHPKTGEPQVRRLDNPKRVACYDLTLSAPKSVSIAWARAPAKIRDAIYAAHRARPAIARDNLRART